MLPPFPEPSYTFTHTRSDTSSSLYEDGSLIMDPMQIVRRFLGQMEYFANGLVATVANVVYLSMRAELDEMKKTLANTGKSVGGGAVGAITGKSAVVDPYHAGNEFASLFQAPGGPGQP